MKNKKKDKFVLYAYEYSSLALFVSVFIAFSLMSDKFLKVENLVNILQQTAATGIVAVGMTFVLLVAGIDLSVGSIMFLTAAVAGKLLSMGMNLPLVLIVMILVGLLIGFINGFVSTKFKIVAFIVTLATLYVGRGLGLLITETREMKLPESFLLIGTSDIFGIPIPIIIFLVVLAIAHFTLNQTALGRQIYAVGNDPEAAKKSGINVSFILVLVYVISGLTATIGGTVAVAQLGTVAPNFGNEREFVVIASAVLGGTSLFGGRGKVFPGTLIGALLILTIENGLVIINADPYIYPLISGAIIFLAVFIDSMRNHKLTILKRHKIRVS